MAVKSITYNQHMNIPFLFSGCMQMNSKIQATFNTEDITLQYYGHIWDLYVKANSIMKMREEESM